MDKEIWKSIPKFRKYQVSNHGRVRGQKEQIVNTRVSSTKYPRLVVVLSDESKQYRVRLANLVLENFLSANPTPIHSEGNTWVPGYKDGNIYNCHIDNLFWKSQSQCAREANKWRQLRLDFHPKFFRRIPKNDRTTK